MQHSKITKMAQSFSGMFQRQGGFGGQDAPRDAPRRQERHTTVHVESRFRDRARWPEPSRYVANLPRPFYGVKLIRLTSAEILNTELTVRASPPQDANNLLRWSEENFSTFTVNGQDLQLLCQDEYRPNTDPGVSHLFFDAVDDAYIELVAAGNSLDLYCDNNLTLPFALDWTQCPVTRLTTHVQGEVTSLFWGGQLFGTMDAVGVHFAQSRVWRRVPKFAAEYVSNVTMIYAGVLTVTRCSTRQAQFTGFFSIPDARDLPPQTMLLTRVGPNAVHFSEGMYGVIDAQGSMYFPGGLCLTPRRAWTQSVWPSAPLYVRPRSVLADGPAQVTTDGSIRWTGADPCLWQRSYPVWWHLERWSDQQVTQTFAVNGSFRVFNWGTRRGATGFGSGHIDASGNILFAGVEYKNYSPWFPVFFYNNQSLSQLYYDPRHEQYVAVLQSNMSSGETFFIYEDGRVQQFLLTERDLPVRHAITCMVPEGQYDQTTLQAAVGQVNISFMSIYESVPQISWDSASLTNTISFSMVDPFFFVYASVDVGPIGCIFLRLPFDQSRLHFWPASGDEWMAVQITASSGRTTNGYTVTAAQLSGAFSARRVTPDVLMLCVGVLFNTPRTPLNNRTGAPVPELPFGGQVTLSIRVPVQWQTLSVLQVAPHEPTTEFRPEYEVDSEHKISELWTSGPSVHIRTEQPHGFADGDLVRLFAANGTSGGSTHVVPIRRVTLAPGESLPVMEYYEGGSLGNSRYLYNQTAAPTNVTISFWMSTDDASGVPIFGCDQSKKFIITNMVTSNETHHAFDVGVVFACETVLTVVSKWEPALLMGFGLDALPVHHQLHRARETAAFTELGASCRVWPLQDGYLRCTVVDANVLSVPVRLPPQVVLTAPATVQRHARTKQMRLKFATNMSLVLCSPGLNGILSNAFHHFARIRLNDCSLVGGEVVIDPPIDVSEILIDLRRETGNQADLRGQNHSLTFTVIEDVLISENTGIDSRRGLIPDRNMGFKL